MFRINKCMNSENWKRDCEIILIVAAKRIYATFVLRQLYMIMNRLNGNHLSRLP